MSFFLENRVVKSGLHFWQTFHTVPLADKRGDRGENRARNKPMIGLLMAVLAGLIFFSPFHSTKATYQFLIVLGTV